MNKEPNEVRLLADAGKKILRIIWNLIVSVNTFNEL